MATELAMNEYERMQDDAKRITAFIRNNYKLHEEAMGMSLCAKMAPEPHVRARAQKRFEEIYAYAAEQLGIKL